MNETASETPKKRHRSSPTGKDRLIRVSNVLLSEAVRAASASEGSKISERDVISDALREYVMARKDALIEDAIQVVERYA